MLALCHTCSAHFLAVLTDEFWFHPLIVIETNIQTVCTLCVHVHVYIHDGDCLRTLSQCVCAYLQYVSPVIFKMCYIHVSQSYNELCAHRSTDFDIREQSQFRRQFKESLNFPSDELLDWVCSEDSPIDALWLDASNKYESSLPPPIRSRSLHFLTVACSLVAIVIKCIIMNNHWYNNIYI